jgi:hypothetical protein
VSIRIPEGTKPGGIHLLVSRLEPAFEIREDKIFLSVPQIYDHEIIGIDLV